MPHTYWQDLIDELDGAEYRFGIITPSTPVYRVESDARAHRCRGPLADGPCEFDNSKGLLP